MAEDVQVAEPTPQGGDTPEPEAPTSAVEPDAQQPQEESPNIAFTLVDDTDPGAGRGSDDGGGMVPSGRLREEADRARRAETQVAAMQAMIAARQGQQQAPQNGQADPEAQLRDRFGTAEEGGPAAYEAVKDVANNQMSQGLRAMEARLRNEFSGQIDNKVGAVTSSLATAQKLSDMKSQGLLDDAGERVMSQRMGEMVASNQQWGQPQNQGHLINQVYMEMLTTGRIKPRVAPTVNPGTPSDNGNSAMMGGGTGGGGPVQMTEKQATEQWEAELLEVQKTQPKKLGGLTMDQLKAIDPHGGPQQVTHVPGVEHKYVHTR
tara:strand:+ start:71 stop:1030 length:960 start_codon:yes stop_codon:yes gene_type:complete